MPGRVPRGQYQGPCVNGTTVALRRRSRQPSLLLREGDSPWGVTVMELRLRVHRVARREKSIGREFRPLASMPLPKSWSCPCRPIRSISRRMGKGSYAACQQELQLETRSARVATLVLLLKRMESSIGSEVFRAVVQPSQSLP